MLNVMFSPSFALSWHIICTILQKSLQKGKKEEKNLGKTTSSYFSTKQALCLLYQDAPLHRFYGRIPDKTFNFYVFSFVLVTDRNPFKASLLLYSCAMPVLLGYSLYLMFIDHMNETVG